MKATVQTAARDADGLLGHSLLLMVFTHLASAANLLFHVVMGRALPKAEYGILASLLGVGLVVATPMMALGIAMAHFAARFAAEGRRDDLRRLVARWVRRLAVVAAAVVVTAVGFSRPLADALRLPGTAPVVVTACGLACTLLIPVFVGSLQGLQSFVWMSLAQHSWAFTRLATGWALIGLLGGTAMAGLLGHVAGLAVSVAVGAVALVLLTPREPAAGDVTRGVDAYFLRSLCALTGFGILMNADVILVKHFFDPETAGGFARAATIARIVVFFPQPVAAAMFPKVVSAGFTSRAQRRTLWRAIAVSAVLIGASVLACCLAPGLALRLVYGDSAPAAEALRLVRTVTIVLSPLGLAFLLMNFEIAQRRFAVVGPLLAGAAAYLAGVSMWHGSVWQIVAVIGVCSLAATAALSRIALAGAAIDTRVAVRHDPET